MRAHPRLLFFVLWLALEQAAAATLDPELAAVLDGAAPDQDVGVVIVAFDGDDNLHAADLLVLQSAGIHRGYMLEELAMVAAPATASQVRALVNQPAIRSIWSNRELRYYMHQATVLGGVDRLRTDPKFRSPIGLPASGRGDFSVVVNDSGIDGIHADLQFGSHVVQNVQVLTDTATLSGFTPLLAVENVPNTDSHVGPRHSRCRDHRRHRRTLRRPVRGRRAGLAGFMATFADVFAAGL